MNKITIGLDEEVFESNNIGKYLDTLVYTSLNYMSVRPHHVSQPIIKLDCK